MSGLRVRAAAFSMPKRWSRACTRAVARHDVNESGNVTSTRAVPSSPVTTSGCQNMVERKSLRTCTAGCPAPTPPASPATSMTASSMAMGAAA